MARRRQRGQDLGARHKLQWEVHQHKGEISELQKALSDMQVYLFQEREQALRLYAENDRLKIRELEDRKKIQHLLALVGPDAGEITYFHRDPPHKSRGFWIIGRPQNQELDLRVGRFYLFKINRSLRRGAAKVSLEGNRASRSEEGVVNRGSPEQYRRDNQTLLLQVEALQAQMEEQTRLSKEQVESLLEDRRIHVEEGPVQHQRDQDHITALTDKLERTQNLMYESTRDFLQLKLETRAHEKGWMVEKDQLLQELNSNQDRLGEAKDSHGREQSGSRGPSSMALLLTQPQPDTQHVHREELRAMQEELKQANCLTEMYREQCVTLETDLAQIREEGDVGREIFKDRSDKIAKRLQMMTQRYEALEKRRAIEVEGFKTDIKYLRQKLKDVEKQLFKVTLNVGPNQDLAILHEVCQTNARTRKVQGELKTLKAKIYGLENDLRYS
ncbi:coiled-coil domain-containing protein 77 [Coregonus clupeaformis]|uniref:coiled-coil domain-containing protein 77 n=1 Tax=Coregonus clupeaformis TaxID=59861 RepID=UPI001BE07377|nr:coiled-coil domain-containing protein 77 [Coregonus clupeaformis]